MAGYCLVIPSFLVQLPQIVKIWRAGSADGIRLSSVVFDLFALTVGGAFNWAKGYPFSAWGELVPAIVQTAIVAGLVIRWVRRCPLVVQVVLFIGTLGRGLGKKMCCSIFG